MLGHKILATGILGNRQVFSSESPDGERSLDHPEPLHEVLRLAKTGRGYTPVLAVRKGNLLPGRQLKSSGYRVVPNGKVEDPVLGRRVGRARYGRRCELAFPCLAEPTPLGQTLHVTGSLAG